MLLLPAVEVHPLWPNTSLRAYCKSMGIAVVAYASMGCGHLLHHPVVTEAASQAGKPAAQVRSEHEWVEQGKG